MRALVSSLFHPRPPLISPSLSSPLYTRHVRSAFRDHIITWVPTHSPTYLLTYPSKRMRSPRPVNSQLRHQRRLWASALSYRPFIGVCFRCFYFILIYLFYCLFVLLAFYCIP
ncbi:uncharacterized protein K452DRAFT_91759 [Aplosporella prunicola CBS 121167]|uniref:Uncharacterized protein n=1 Tax=Aplosporella prunicola CBS 121167 TaxID=1176127 RepID=A0A6A6B4W9_9PEZI|nr:uncharacterized protein K452DRAFT_91759 [Aplosporella prunicola CBS 121167]KAF2138315.1 hypothetical protein K452DRAFT_91759 [Aplosporella prunicola CBS 121167]